MFPEVHQHVDHRVAGLAGRLQGVGMVAVAPDGTAAAAGVVDGAGQSNGEATSSARQRSAVLGLDDEVHVVVLRGELDHAELDSTCLADGLLTSGKGPLGTKRRYVPARP